MKKWFLGLLLALSISPAWAQNPQCPTRPIGDNTNACASTAFVHAATKTPLTTSTIFYVNPATGNNASDVITCTNSSTPCLTRQYVFDQVKQYYRLEGAGNIIYMLLQNGTYADTLNMVGNIDGVESQGQFIITPTLNADGTCGNRANVTIAPAAGVSAFSAVGTKFYLQCLKMDLTASAGTEVDFLSLGGDVTLAIRWLEFTGNPTGNVVTASNSGFMYIEGDLWINTNGQATLYFADNWSTYPTINNVKSQIQTGTLTSGSKVITGLSSTSGMLAGYYVRGTGTASTAFAEGTFIVSVDSGTQITVSSNSTVTGATSLTIGGIFVNYIGTRTVSVAQVFATTGAALNLQALEFRSCTSFTNCAVAGTVSGQKGVLRSGAVVDFGAVDPTTLPGTLPWYVGGQTGSGLKSDGTDSVFELPTVASGIISGEKALSRVRFSKYIASGLGFGGSLDTSSIGQFSVLGPGSFDFLGNDGASNYGRLTNINTNAVPQIVLGIGTVAPDISSASTAGIHIYNSRTGQVAGIRIQNDDGANSSDLRLFANTAVGQILTVGAFPLQLGAGSAVTLQIPASGGGLSWLGSSSGSVTVKVQAAAGTYNFNLPTAAGTSGQPLLSGGGGATAMTFGTLLVPAGGTGLTTVAQGDIIYGSATDTYSRLTKDTNATRYLANTGTSNNPAWAQVNLANGVTGTLPVGNGGTGLTTGTSGGVLAFTGSTTIASSAALGANCIVYGGGAGVVPATSTSTCPTVSSVGIVTVPNTTNSSSAAAGAITTSGGIYSAKDLVTGTGILKADNNSSTTNLSVQTRSAGAALFSSSSGGTYFAAAPPSAAATYNYFQATAATSGSPLFQIIDGTAAGSVGFRILMVGTTPTFSIEDNNGANSILTANRTQVRVLDTTAATTTTDGAVRVDGGISVAGALVVGTYAQTGVVAVGSLPACGAGTKGARHFVNDSNAVSYTAGIGAVVAAGGTTNVPVVCDGTNWRIGANDNFSLRKVA